MQSSPDLDPTPPEGGFLSQDAQEVFAELVNMAFGRAAVPLSELLETFVVLQIPLIQCLESTELRGFLRDHIGPDSELLVVQQAFTMELEGQAMLFFDSNCRSVFSELLDEHTEEGFRAAVLEVANIVLGACVGQLAGQLSVSTSYSPPVLILDHGYVADLPLPSSERYSQAVAVTTSFMLENREVRFQLILLLPDITLDWLGKALDRMWLEM